MRRAWIGATLAIALAMGPMPVLAADPAADQAQSEFQDGTLRYETADYAGAVEAFRRAYSAAMSIEDPELRENASNAALFNMARAHIEAYVRDEDSSRLVQAREILEKFIAAQDEIGEELDAEGLLAKIDGLEGKGPAVPGESDSPPETLPSSEPDSAATSKPKKERKPGVALIGAGSGVAVLSIAGFGILGAGAVRANAAESDFLAASDAMGREAADADGRQANGLVITGSVLGAALLATGAVLIALGVKKRRGGSERSAGTTWELDARGVHF